MCVSARPHAAGMAGIRGTVRSGGVTVDWDLVPLWWSAGAATAALVIATWAARAAWRQVKHLAEQQRDRERDAEREQASKVAAWLSHDYRDSSPESLVFTLHYVNRSELPVFTMTVYPVNFPDRQFHFAVVPPNSEPQRAMSFELPEEGREKARDSVAEFVQRHGIPETRVPDFRGLLGVLIATGVVSEGVEIEFTDMHNRTWSRRSGGELVPGKLPERTGKTGSLNGVVARAYAQLASNPRSQWAGLGAPD